MTGVDEFLARLTVDRAITVEQYFELEAQLYHYSRVHKDAFGFSDIYEITPIVSIYIIEKNCVLEKGVTYYECWLSKNEYDFVIRNNYE